MTIVRQPNFHLNAPSLGSDGRTSRCGCLSTGRDRGKRLPRYARRFARAVLLGIAGLGLAETGCTAISVEPSCPQELEVGQSGEVRANEQNPGAIATYQWEVLPATGGTLADSTLPSTTLKALEEGAVNLRLTASDGIYQVQAWCRVNILPPPNVVVTLVASPAETPTGQTVTLTCTSTGAEPAESLEITQTSGARISLTPVSEGVVSLVPLIAGTPVFACVGTSADGEQSRPATVTLTVTTGGGR